MRDILDHAAFRLRRRRILRGATLAAIVGAALCAILLAARALAANLGWLRANWPAASLLALIPAFAAIGALRASFPRVSLSNAAIFLDARLQLREQLSTAAEMIDAASPMADLVRRRALAALAAIDWKAVSFGGPLHRAVATLCLLSMFCAALLALPVAHASNEMADQLSQQAARVQRMSTDQRLALAKQLQQWAREPDEAKPDRSAIQSRGLFASADAATLDADLRRLEELLRAGQVRLTKLPQPLRGEKLQDDFAAAPGARQNAAAVAPALQSPPAQPMWVTYPHTPAAAQTQPAAPADPGYLPPEDAWRAACRQASDAVSNQQVPPEYRQQVKDYFLPQQANGRRAD